MQYPTGSGEPGRKQAVSAQQVKHKVRGQAGLQPGSRVTRPRVSTKASLCVVRKEKQPGYTERKDLGNRAEVPRTGSCPDEGQGHDWWHQAEQPQPFPLQPGLPTPGAAAGSLGRDTRNTAGTGVEDFDKAWPMLQVTWSERLGPGVFQTWDCFPPDFGISAYS